MQTSTDYSEQRTGRDFEMLIRNKGYERIVEENECADCEKKRNLLKHPK